MILFGQPLSDASIVVFSSASSDVKQIGHDSGLNLHGQAIFLNNHPELVNADTLASACPHESEVIEYGCYLPSSQKIYILQVDDPNLKPIELTAVAHETLHAIWNDMAPNDKQSISQELTSLYNSKSSSILTSDAEPYQGEAQETFVDELHSLAGSEVGVAYMSNTLSAHYLKYFSAQNETVQAVATFNQNVDSQIAALNTQRAQLDSDNLDIDNYKAAHLDSIKSAMQLDLYYGDIYTYNKNVDAYNNNLGIYKDMIAKYNTNVDTYNASRQTFIDAYSALYPNKAIPVGDAK